jgi:NAD(P)-dependent dehydrogenase (short-subunit alcohol dehydrogenase family)
VMRQQGGGSIVNVASVVEMGMAGSSTYGATKGAIASLTYCWAALGLADGVRVNAVSPRATTRMVVANGRAFEEANPTVPPDLTAPLVSYLLSDKAAMVTGQVFRLQVDTLAVLRRPRPVEPVADVPAWSAEAVEAALTELVGTDQQPYGWRDPLR